jgi:hypothetical protein
MKRSRFEHGGSAKKSNSAFLTLLDGGFAAIGGMAEKSS